MKLTPEQLATARAILHEGPGNFTALAERAGLNPATAWIDADLRGVVMEADDNLAGYVFLRTDLRGADLRPARGKDRAKFQDVITDATTLGLPVVVPLTLPDDYMDQVKAMILRGEEPPAEWVPFITRLEISEPQWWDGRGRLAFSNLRPLAGLTAITSLNLRGTLVSDLAPLVGLHNLTRLDLAVTPVRDLAPLAGLDALSAVNLAGTRVRDLAPLAGLRSLTSLDLAGTQVTDLTPLAGLSALTSLYIARAPVRNVAPLARLNALITLDLSDTRVHDLTPLVRLSALLNLSIDPSQTNKLNALRDLPLLRIYERGQRIGRLISRLLPPPRHSKRSSSPLSGR